MGKELNRITGHANAGGQQQFLQIATAAVAMNFYGLMAVNGDAVITAITDILGNDRLTDFGDVVTAYEGVYYPGSFASVTLASGEAVIYLDEQ